MNWLSSPTNHVRPLCMQLETLSVQVGLGSTWAILSAGLRFNFWVIVKALLLNYSVAYGRQGSGGGGGGIWVVGGTETLFVNWHTGKGVGVGWASI